MPTAARTPPTRLAAAAAVGTVVAIVVLGPEVVVVGALGADQVVAVPLEGGGTVTLAEEIHEVVKVSGHSVVVVVTTSVVVAAVELVSGHSVVVVVSTSVVVQSTELDGGGVQTEAGRVLVPATQFFSQTASPAVGEDW